MAKSVFVLRDLAISPIHHGARIEENAAVIHRQGERLMHTMINACKAWGDWRAVQQDLLPRTLEDFDIVFNLCSRSAGDNALTVNQLIASCLGSRNTLLRRLRALIDSGVVSITASGADRRLRELALTKKGIRMARKARISLRRLGAAMRER